MGINVLFGLLNSLLQVFFYCCGANECLDSFSLVLFYCCLFWFWSLLRCRSFRCFGLLVSEFWLACFSFYACAWSLRGGKHCISHCFLLDVYNAMLGGVAKTLLPHFSEVF